MKLHRHTYILVTLLVTYFQSFIHGQDTDICEAAGSCLRDASEGCDRLRADCPPCLYYSNGGGFNCYDKNEGESSCPFGEPAKDCTNQIRAVADKIKNNDELTEPPTATDNAEESGSNAEGNSTTAIFGLNLETWQIALISAGAVAFIILVIIIIYYLCRPPPKRQMYKNAIGAYGAHKTRRASRISTNSDSRQSSMQSNQYGYSEFEGSNYSVSTIDYNGDSLYQEPDLESMAFKYKEENRNPSEFNGSEFNPSEFNGSEFNPSEFNGSEFNPSEYKMSFASSAADEDWAISTVTSIPDFDESALKKGGNNSLTGSIDGGGARASKLYGYSSKGDSISSEFDIVEPGFSSITSDFTVSDGNEDAFYSITSSVDDRDTQNIISNQDRDSIASYFNKTSKSTRRKKKEVEI